MGEHPTTIDATLYAWLLHAMRVPFSESNRQIRQFAF